MLLAISMAFASPPSGCIRMKLAIVSPELNDTAPISGITELPSFHNEPIEAITKTTLSDGNTISGLFILERDIKYAKDSATFTENNIIKKEVFVFIFWSFICLWNKTITI